MVGCERILQTLALGMPGHTMVVGAMSGCVGDVLVCTTNGNYCAINAFFAMRQMTYVSCLLAPGAFRRA